MVIHSAEFIVSNTNPSKCPEGNKPEFAFIGRSNVGKSSLINLLVNRKNLAKTSSTPGKTDTINHFLINSQWYLVDLPGYGYAKRSRSMSKGWGPMIETYLARRKSLINTFILIDSRLTPQPIDIEFIRWMGQQGIPFSMVFTKADKLSRNELKRTQLLWRNEMSKEWEEMPPIFATSAVSRAGRDELLAYIETLVSNS